MDLSEVFYWNKHRNLYDVLYSTSDSFDAFHDWFTYFSNNRWEEYQFCLKRLYEKELERLKSEIMGANDIDEQQERQLRYINFSKLLVDNTL